jgi:hypothetical protein
MSVEPLPSNGSITISPRVVRSRRASTSIADGLTVGWSLRPRRASERGRHLAHMRFIDLTQLSLGDPKIVERDVLFYKVGQRVVSQGTRRDRRQPRQSFAALAALRPELRVERRLRDHRRLSSPFMLDPDHPGAEEGVRRAFSTACDLRVAGAGAKKDRR